jgi:hypothetical protein
VEEAKTDDDFDGVRDSPAFRDLVEKAGME